MFGAKADETVIATEDGRLQEVLPVLNKCLGESKYLAGEDFTVLILFIYDSTQKNYNCN
jgi:glutathione S-transferase